MKRKTVGWILLGVLALPATYVAYVAVAYGHRLVSPEVRRKGRITKSIDGLRTMLLYDAVGGVGVARTLEPMATRQGER